MQESECRIQNTGDRRLEMGDWKLTLGPIVNLQSPIPDPYRLSAIGYPPIPNPRPPYIKSMLSGILT